MTLANRLPIDPKSLDTPETLSYEARLRVIKTQLEAQLGREMTNEDLADWLTENSTNKVEMAQLDAQVLEYSAQMEDAWGHAVELEAAQVAQSGTWGYHPANYKSVEEYLQNALQGTSHGDGHFKRLKTLVSLVVPFCVQKGISIPDAAWAEGNRAKFEFIAERVPELRSAVAAGEEVPEEVEQRIADMLDQAADKSVTLNKLKETYPAAKRRIELAEAWAYQNGGNRSVLVIELTNPVQGHRIRELLGHLVRMHMGTGREPILAELAKGGIG